MTINFSGKVLPAMATSAGMSILLSVVTNRGRPYTMAAIGAFTVLTHLCLKAIFQRTNLNEDTLHDATGIPRIVTSSIKFVVSVLVTQNIMRLVGGPNFNVTSTAIATIAMNFLYSNSNQKNSSFIVLA